MLKTLPRKFNLVPKSFVSVKSTLETRKSHTKFHFQKRRGGDIVEKFLGVKSFPPAFLMVHP